MLTLNTLRQAEHDPGQSKTGHHLTGEYQKSVCIFHDNITCSDDLSQYLPHNLHAGYIETALRRIVIPSTTSEMFNPPNFDRSNIILPQTPPIASRNDILYVAF